MTTGNITLRYDSVDRAFLQHIPMAPGASTKIVEGVKQRHGMTMAVFTNDGALITEDRWNKWSETAEEFVCRLLTAASEQTHERRRRYGAA